ncbi:hypothetical protein PIB30_040770 [Stylosanthes scabra]|uniref:Uncharacterized protein n=1 Tax=Stylosanthes scabra TaxID=79078 RepID=A0ABU6ZDE3_9FABA|nr:hypothetical protein [Stylosanthes scabra]
MKSYLGGSVAITRVRITCMWWEDNSLDDAYLQGLEIALQFLIEDLNDNYGSTRVISYRRDIVNWVNGCELTSWENKFLRNKVWSKRWLFDGVQLIYKQDSDYIGGRWDILEEHLSNYGISELLVDDIGPIRPNPLVNSQFTWPIGSKIRLKGERFDKIIKRSHPNLNHPQLYKLGETLPQGTHSLTPNLSY